MMAEIATGETEDITTEGGKNAAAVALGPHGWQGGDAILALK
jgi:hypothetical protein